MQTEPSSRSRQAPRSGVLPLGRTRITHLLSEAALLLIRSALWVGATTVGTVINAWGALTLLLLLTPSNIWGYLALLVGILLVGAVGGAVTGAGQALALRRWLNGAAAAGSFLSTVLASTVGLAAGTLLGWCLQGVWGETAGALSGLIVYGVVFGLIQSPMVAYVTHRPWVWVPANMAAAVLGALVLLVRFDLSGGRPEMLQFRYIGLIYALVVGIVFLVLSRRVRKSIADSGMGRRQIRYSADHEEIQEGDLMRSHSTPENIAIPRTPSRPLDSPAGDDVIEGTFRVIP